jgi:hypothetical protein
LSDNKDIWSKQNRVEQYDVMLFSEHVGSVCNLGEKQLGFATPVINNSIINVADL